MATKDFSNKKKSGMQKMVCARNAEMSGEPEKNEVSLLIRTKPIFEEMLW